MFVGGRGVCRELMSGVPVVNHAQIAAEGIRFRLAMLGHADGTARRVDPVSAAKVALSCGDPLIDGAIRHLGSSLVRAGFTPEQLGSTWEGPAFDELFARQPDLIDSLDAILERVFLRAA